MMRQILLVSCFFLVFSCTKEANVKLPETKSLPVLYSYLCPSDSLIRLRLTYSSPLYNSNEIDVLKPVRDADVKISSTQGTGQLIFNAWTGYYELNTGSYPVMPGQTYKMTVTTAQGNIATAETQVPVSTVPINAVSVETIPENYFSSDRIKASFTDEPGRTNYYRLAALYASVFKFESDTMTSDTRITELYSDLNRDGQAASLAGRFYRQTDSIGDFSSEHYEVFLFNCSLSYFSFHNSLRNYSGGDPFSEPSLMYTNVSGGFGCFGAYTRSSFRYKKK